MTALHSPRKLLSGLLLSLALLSPPAAAQVEPVQAKGTKFFDANGLQWFVKGVVYQLTPEDPLADGPQCQRDAALMRDLGVNAIRVLTVQGRKKHDECMKAFADAGIYVFVNLDSPNMGVNQEKPRWTSMLFQRYATTIDSFQQYPNLAGFVVGDRTVTKPSGAHALPFIKAAIRDVKAYMAVKRYRPIMVGHTAADVPTVLEQTLHYLGCGPADERADFVGLSTFKWCGASNYEQSGYGQLNAIAQRMTVPIFFSETGCNVESPRTFTDQAAIFGSRMAPFWSGAVVYEWLEEVNHFGLVRLEAPEGVEVTVLDEINRQGEPVPIQPDFDNLKRQWQQAKPELARDYNYTSPEPALTCPRTISGVWEVEPEGELPGSPREVESLLRLRLERPTKGSSMTKAEVEAGSNPNELPRNWRTALSAMAVLGLTMFGWM